MRADARFLFHLSVALAGLALAVAVPASAATITLVNIDPPGQGLNDPTPVAPIGGNPGTTLGQQRLNVYNLGTQLWGAVIESDVTILVSGTFTPLACTPTSGVLGAAGAAFIFRDFPGATFAGTWFHSALADALEGSELNPGFVDIVSFFNSRIGTDPGCLTGRNWYYGFDNNEGIDFDFLTVVMHEIAHGLGFSNFVNEATGARPQNLPDIYSKFTLDLTVNQTWDQFTMPSQFTASAIRNFQIVWNGDAVTDAAPFALGPRPSALVLAPPSIGGSYEGQAAAFGPPLVTAGGTTGKLVVADDGVGATADACEPIVNNLDDKIAIVDRGICTFVAKVLNAQAAGAKGVIVANNVAVGLPGMGGVSPDVTIPSLGVSQADGNLLKTASQHNVVTRLFLDEDFLAGASQGFVRLFAPAPVQLGSSISHWDTTATPNLLMEPAINPDLRSATELDLTPELFQDIGWILQP